MAFVLFMSFWASRAVPEQFSQEFNSLEACEAAFVQVRDTMYSGWNSKHICVPKGE